MQHKIEVLTQIFNWLSANFNSATGALLAFVISLARSYLFPHGKSFKHTLLDGFACACLTLGATGVLGVVGLPEETIIFLGSMLGFLGVDVIRKFLLAYVDKKVGDDKDD